MAKFALRDVHNGTVYGVSGNPIFLLKIVVGSIMFMVRKGELDEMSFEAFYGAEVFEIERIPDASQ